MKIFSICHRCQWHRGNWFMKKTRSRKSRDTVPLSSIMPVPPPPTVWALKPTSCALVHKINYAPMIYTALCIMFWMRAIPCISNTRSSGRGLGPVNLEFLGPKWHSPIRSMPFHRAQPPATWPRLGYARLTWPKHIYSVKCDKENALNGRSLCSRWTLGYPETRIHERTISSRFLGIILSVLRLEVSLYNVYISNQFQTTFAQGEAGVKSISRGDCE